MPAHFRKLDFLFRAGADESGNYGGPVWSLDFVLRYCPDLSRMLDTIGIQDLAFRAQDFLSTDD